MSEEKNNKGNKIKLVIFIILLFMVCLAILSTCNVHKFSEWGKLDLPSVCIEARCKKNKTAKTINIAQNYITTFKCLGKMKKINGYNKTIVLNNNKILLYDNSSFELYDPKSNKFTLIKEYTFNNENYNYYWFQNYKKLSNFEYLIFPDLIYNEKTNDFEGISNIKLKKYNNFVKSRKYDHNETKYVTTFNNNHLYISYNANDTALKEIWIENSITLTRSKYGLLKTNKVDFSAVMLNNGKVLIIGGITPNKEILKDIELFDPNTGEITLNARMDYARVASKSILLNNNKVLIVAGKTLNKQDHSLNYLYNAEIYTPNKTTTDKTIKFSSKYKFNRGDNDISIVPIKNDYKLMLLNGDEVFLYGLIAMVFNPTTNEFYNIDNLFTIRQNNSLTKLSNGEILIAGGNLNANDSLDYYKQYKIILYNSAELFSLNNK